MNKIINGKKYDTDTAKFIGNYSYVSPIDFNRVSDDLYKKKTGEFFLYEEYGITSQYDDWNSWKKIIPLTTEETKKWVEENLDADTYEELFGEVEE